MHNDDFSEITELNCGLFLTRVRSGKDVLVIGYYHSREAAIEALRNYKLRYGIKS